MSLNYNQFGTQFVFARSTSKISDQISNFLKTLGQSYGVQHLAFNLNYFTSLEKSEKFILKNDILRDSPSHANNNISSNASRTTIDNSDLIGIANIFDILKKSSSSLKLTTTPQNYYKLIENKFKSSQSQIVYELAKETDLLADLVVHGVEKLGENLDKLVENGTNLSELNEGYLLQKFSENLLGQDTFFIEFIYRHNNPYGLGKKNVEYLWRSIEK